MLDEQVICFAEVGQRRVPVERQHEVATVDLGACVQAPDNLFHARIAGKIQQCLDHFILGVAVGRQFAAYRRDDTSRSSHILNTTTDRGRFM